MGPSRRFRRSGCKGKGHRVWRALLFQESSRLQAIHGQAMQRSVVCCDEFASFHVGKCWEGSEAMEMLEVLEVSRELI